MIIQQEKRMNIFSKSFLKVKFLFESTFRVDATNSKHDRIFFEMWYENYIFFPKFLLVVFIISESK